jgi:hypothetical protein
MGRVYEEISTELAEWIGQQKMFFVGTSPLSESGSVNISPKGYDTFRIVDSQTVAYLDLTGSGAETIAHLRENGRITFMWCSFEGPPRIVRIHGRGRVVSVNDATFQGVFNEIRGARSIIVATAERISDSCGYSVPVMKYEEERTRLREWADNKTEQELNDYRQMKNSSSIDGLPALEKGPRS